MLHLQNLTVLNEGRRLRLMIDSFAGVIFGLLIPED